MSRARQGVAMADQHVPAMIDAHRRSRHTRAADIIDDATRCMAVSLAERAEADRPDDDPAVIAAAAIRLAADLHDTAVDDTILSDVSHVCERAMIQTAEQMREAEGFCDGDEDEAEDAGDETETETDDEPAPTGIWRFVGVLGR